MPIEKATVREIQRIGEKQARAEYRKLADIVRKRLNRLESSRYRRSSYVRTQRAEFMNLKDIKDQATLARQLYRLQKVVKSPLSTIKGQMMVEEKTRQSLVDAEYEFAREGDLFDFGDYMDYYRDFYNGTKYDSERAASVYDEAQRIGISEPDLLEDFDFYMDNLNALRDIQPQEYTSSVDIRKLIKKHKKKKGS